MTIWNVDKTAAKPPAYRILPRTDVPRRAPQVIKSALVNFGFSPPLNKAVINAAKKIAIEVVPSIIPRCAPSSGRNPCLPCATIASAMYMSKRRAKGQLQQLQGDSRSSATWCLIAYTCWSEYDHWPYNDRFLRSFDYGQRQGISVHSAQFQHTKWINTWTS